VHWKASKLMSIIIDESLQAAAFWHGLLEHSSTSTSQLPPKIGDAVLSDTEHCVV